jgi:hypothetical protein
VAAAKLGMSHVAFPILLFEPSRWLSSTSLTRFVSSGDRVYWRLRGLSLYVSWWRSARKTDDLGNATANERDLTSCIPECSRSSRGLNRKFSSSNNCIVEFWSQSESSPIILVRKAIPSSVVIFWSLTISLPANDSATSRERVVSKVTPLLLAGKY